jgi:hypothetical protein
MHSGKGSTGKGSMEGVIMLLDSLTIRSDVGCFQNSVKIAEGCAFVEFLLSYDFIAIFNGQGSP